MNLLPLARRPGCRSSTASPGASFRPPSPSRSVLTRRDKPCPPVPLAGQARRQSKARSPGTCRHVGALRPAGERGLGSTRGIPWLRSVTPVAGHVRPLRCTAQEAR